ncbi:hypothetical protein DRQ12_00940 [candidate division KSB1 bacterium]|nr:MAG: hypothetical protein DRQ12_00940 [candidate division KSB1 bacterium]
MDEITTTRKTKNLTSIKQRQMSLFWGYFGFFREAKRDRFSLFFLPFPPGGKAEVENRLFLLSH